MSDDDKSWREIDRQRDKSDHVSDEDSNRRDRQGDHKYKQKLEKVFQSGGNVPDELEGVMDEVGPEEGSEEAERQEEIDKLRDADGFRQFAKAVNVFMQKDYRMPDDEDLLIRMLDHPDNEIVRTTLAHIVDLADRRELQRTAPLKSRLSTIRTMTDDSEILSLTDEIEQHL
ncbi:MAG: hypothetical protein ABEN55_00890 [Bradymonadaceae bacterium]